MPQNCAVREIVIAIANVGTTWTLKIQDQASPAFILVPLFTVALPTDFKPIIIKFDDPVRMFTGVDAVTAGTPGELAIWITTDSGQPLPT